MLFTCSTIDRRLDDFPVCSAELKAETRDSEDVAVRHPSTSQANRPTIHMVAGNFFQAHRPSGPFEMCSADECASRQESGEISIFERQRVTLPTPVSSLQIALRKPASSRATKSIQSRHVLDQCLAVTKFRRSAEDRYPPRTLQQLHATLTYLQRLIAASPTVAPDAKSPIPSYRSIVEFSMDRLRAISVDCLLQRRDELHPEDASHSAPHLYVRLTQTYIFLLYLVIDDATVSRKLGLDALRASISSYWTCSCSERREDDCMLAYGLLLGLQKGDGQSQGLVEHSFYQVCRQNVQENATHLPKFVWALRLAADWQMGLWHVVLQNVANVRDSSFGTVVRCIVAPSLPWIRWNALLQYNSSYMKQEQVLSSEIARLLFFNVANIDQDHASDQQACHLQTEILPARKTRAAEFLHIMGFPSSDATSDGVHVFKSASPITDYSILTKRTLFQFRDDSFVFRLSAEEINTRTFSNGETVCLPKAAWTLEVLD